MRTVVETVTVTHVIDTGTQGPPGKNALIEEAIDDVTVAPDRVFSSKRIMELLNPFSLHSFTVAPSAAEIGSVVDTLLFSWAANLPLDSVALDNGIGSIPLPASSYTLNDAAITTAKTFVLTATGGGATDTAQASLAFLNRVYWGTYATQTSDAEILKAMSSQLSGSRGRSITFDCSGGRFFHLAYPKRLGAASFRISNLPYSDASLTEVDITNAYGYAETYYVYYCNVIQHGSSITLEVS